MNMLVMIKDTLKANRSLSRAEADWLVEEIQRLTAEVERLERVRQKFIRENRSKGNE